MLLSICEELNINKLFVNLLKYIEKVCEHEGKLTSLDITEMSYLNGVTSNIQTQINTKALLTNTLSYLSINLTEQLSLTSLSNGISIGNIGNDLVFKNSLGQINTLVNTLISETILYSSNFSSIGDEFNNIGWTTTSGGIISTAYGLDNYLQLNKQYSLKNRTASFKIRLGSNTRLLLFTKHIESNIGFASCFEIDASGSVKIYRKYNDSNTLPTLLSSVNYSFQTDRDYIISIKKVDVANYIYVKDGLTGIETLVNYDETTASGYQFDSYAIATHSGTHPTIKEIKVSCKAKVGCRAIVLGDSITEGSYLSNSKLSYSQKIIDSLGGNGDISGRSSGDINGVINRITTEISIIKPVYTIVTIGTNGGTTLTLLLNLITAIRASGSIPIVNNILIKQAINNSVLSASHLTENLYIESARSTYSINGSFMDISTSNGYIVVNGADLSIYNVDSGLYVHLNLLGHIRMFNRQLLDTLEIFDENKFGEENNSRTITGIKTFKGTTQGFVFRDYTSNSANFAMYPYNTPNTNNYLINSDGVNATYNALSSVGNLFIRQGNATKIQIIGTTGEVQIGSGTNTSEGFQVNTTTRFNNITSLYNNVNINSAITSTANSQELVALSVVLTLLLSSFTGVRKTLAKFTQLIFGSSSISGILSLHSDNDVDGTTTSPTLNLLKTDAGNGLLYFGALSGGVVIKGTTLYFNIGNTTNMLMQLGGNLIYQKGGTFTQVTTSLVTFNSTTQGILLLRMTTTQRDAITSLAEGLEIYNLTTHTKDFYNGTVWKVITTN